MTVVSLSVCLSRAWPYIYVLSRQWKAQRAQVWQEVTRYPHLEFEMLNSCRCGEILEPDSLGVLQGRCVQWTISLL